MYTIEKHYEIGKILSKLTELERRIVKNSIKSEIIEIMEVIEARHEPASVSDLYDRFPDDENSEIRISYKEFDAFIKYIELRAKSRIIAISQPEILLRAQQYFDISELDL